MNQPFKLVLASKSPRRVQLLAGAGFQFSQVDIDVEEDYPVHLKGKMIAEFLAEKKADAYQFEENEWVLTADTLVFCGDDVLGKPVSESDAKRMLEKLSGSLHVVITAVCIKCKDSKICFSDETKVFFNPIDKSEIDYYIANYQPFDKAGSYGIQEWIGYIGINRIEGCFYNVMGLPIPKIYQKFKELTR